MGKSTTDNLESEVESGAAQQGQQKKQSDNRVFKLSAELEQKLKAEFPEVLDQINKTGQEWQSAYSKIRAEETQNLSEIQARLKSAELRAGYFDNLANEDSFVDYLVAIKKAEKSGQPVSISTGNRQAGNQQAGNQQAGISDEDLEAWEDPSAVKGLVSMITNTVTENIQEYLQPVMQSMSINKEKSDIDTVRAFVAKERANGNHNYPDVDNDSILFNMRKYGMSAMESYKLAAANYALSGNTSLMQSSGTDDKVVNLFDQNGGQKGIDNTSGGENIKNPTGADDAENTGANSRQQGSAAMMAPGSGAISTMRTKKLNADEKLNEARKIGAKDGTPRESTVSVVDSILKTMSERDGANYSRTDLSNKR